MGSGCNVLQLEFSVLSGGPVVQIQSSSVKLLLVCTVIHLMCIFFIELGNPGPLALSHLVHVGLKKFGGLQPYV